MQLKLQLDQSLSAGVTISKTIPVDSENMNLIKCIESNIISHKCIFF